MSLLPIDLKRVPREEFHRQILRAGIMAELDAVSLYEQLAAMARDELVRKALLDIAREEKTHVGELLALLLKLDEEQAEGLKKGEEEIEALRGSL